MARNKQNQERHAVKQRFNRAQRRARHHSPAEWRALRLRVAELERLTLAHPELAAVAVPTSCMGDRWTYFVTLADRWQAKAGALGLLEVKNG